MITEKKAKEIGNKLNVDWKEVSLKEFRVGLKEELEHRNVTHGDLLVTGKIALAHLEEDKKYYTKLKKAGLIK